MPYELIALFSSVVFQIFMRYMFVDCPLLKYAFAMSIAEILISLYFQISSVVETHLISFFSVCCNVQFFFLKHHYFSLFVATSFTRVQADCSEPQPSVFCTSDSIKHGLILNFVLNYRSGLFDHCAFRPNFVLKLLQQSFQFQSLNFTFELNFTMKYQSGCFNHKSYFLVSSSLLILYGVPYYYAS